MKLSAAVLLYTSAVLAALPFGHPVERDGATIMLGKHVPSAWRAIGVPVADQDGVMVMLKSAHADIVTAEVRIFATRPAGVVSRSAFAVGVNPRDWSVVPFPIGLDAKIEGVEIRHLVRRGETLAEWTPWIKFASVDDR
jgi:hypothetical protein